MRILSKRASMKLAQESELVTASSVGSLLLSDGNIVYSQQMIDELMKCKNDPKYFIERYVRVPMHDNGNQKIVLNENQEQALNAMLEFKRNIILKERCSGFTTLMLGYYLWVSVFQSNKTLLFVSSTHHASIDACKRFKEMLSVIPPWIAPQIVRSIQTSIEFNSGIRINFCAVSENTGRSMTISYLFFDEFAKVNDAQMRNLWMALMPCLESIGEIVVSSSRGPGKFFDELWDSSRCSEHGRPPRFNRIHLLRT